MAYKKVTKRHSWTKEDIKKIVKLWENNTTEEIADEIGIDKSQVYYIAYEIRKIYPKLVQRKSIRGRLRNLITETLG